MSSLYKRANVRQQRILRIVEGAVKNTADHHPEFEFSPKLARSIAKRAAGTLTSEWPVLATPHPASSDKFRSGHPGLHTEPPGSQVSTTLEHEQGKNCTIARSQGRSHRYNGSAPTLRKIIKAITTKIGELKRQGLMAEAEGMIEVMRIIDRVSNNNTKKQRSLLESDAS